MASWLGATEAELGQTLIGLTTAAARLAGVRLQVAAEADRAAVGSHVGAASAAAWWAHQTRTTGRETRAAVRLAHAIEPGGACPLVGAALADGLVLEEQARVIVKALSDLPHDLDPTIRELAEKELVSLAGQHDADALKILGRGILAVVSPEVAEEAERKKLEDGERRAWEEIRFTMTDDGQGMTRGRFTIPTVQAHLLRKLLLAFLARQQREDRRNQRDRENAERAAQAAEQAPHAADEASDETAEDTDGAQQWRFDDTEDPDDDLGGAHIGGFDEPDDSDLGADDVHADDPSLVDDQPRGERRQFGPNCHDHRPAEAKAEARVGPQAMGEAFVAMLEAHPVDAMPHHGGVNPTLVATMTLDQLTGQGEGAQTPVTLDTGEKVTAGQARRWACSAGIIPAVLGTASVVLDMGRRARFHTPRQRLALALRDGGCVAVGCDKPPAMCQAHHMEQWVRDGGPTNVDDGVLLCGHHHRLVHDPVYDHSIRPDGRLAFVRRT